MDLSCGHCGSRGPIIHKETVRLWDDEPETVEEHGVVIDWAHVAAVFHCPACREPTIWGWVWSDAIGDSFAERRLYPTVRDNSAVPEKVRQRLDAALKVKKIEPDFYAVGIRRMLETVCNQEGALGKDLFAKLDYLASKERIPKMLAEVAHELRRLGNLGAHDEDVAVAPADVPVIEDLADAILEYLYRAPAKLTAVRQGIEERKRALTDD